MEQDSLTESMRELDIDLLLLAQDTLFEPMAPVFEWIGAFGNGLVLAAVVVPALLLILRGRARWHVLGIVAATGLSGVVVSLLKVMIDRPRPGELSPALLPPGETVRTIGPDLVGGAFPSGHAQTAFAAAVYLSCLFPRLSPAFGALALLVGLSRVVVGAHFPSDIVAGASIGTVVALLTYIWARRIVKAGDRDVGSPAVRR